MKRHYSDYPIVTAPEVKSMDELEARQAVLFEEKKTESHAEAREDEQAKKGHHGCDFCAIARNEVNRNIVFQDGISVAFLDIRPVFLGHCLLIPYNHYTTMSDLPRELVGPLFENAQLLVKAVQFGLRVDGAFLGINNGVNQSVRHLHIHVIPRKFRDGMRGLFWPRQSYQDGEQMTEICNSIRGAIEKIRSGAGS